ncbi:uncharacterized protein DS421_20g691390 [Arachis hypogaea]|nr:uncharacterized protein DS421_20g691390 [Arachis hypogaea]
MIFMIPQLNDTVPSKPKLRQARRWLAFAHSELESLDEQPDSPSFSNRDSCSLFDERTLYSSVGISEVSVSDLGDENMAALWMITLKEVGAPDITLQPLQICYLDLDANFELKTELINLLPKYHGLPGEDPLKRLKDFQVVCSTARRHGSDEIAVMIFAFSFSLEEKAKEWFYTQPDEVITNWDLLRKKFLEKFFSPEKTDRLRMEISCIMQRDGEILYEYWKYFKKLLESCLYHRINDLVLISYFCQGLVPQDKLLINASSSGSLTKHKTAEEAWKVISNLTDSMQHLRTRNPQPRSIGEVSPSGDAILTKTLGEMTILLRQIHQSTSTSNAPSSTTIASD